MKHCLLLFLLSTFASSLALSQSAATTKKGPASGKSTAKKTVAKKTVAKKTTAGIPSSQQGRAPRSAKKKSTRTAAAAPRRSGQTQPTPERYREIQQALADKGYLKSDPSGAWDAASVDALTRFQSDHKLPPTGKITSASLIGLGLGPNNTSPKAAEAPPKSPEPAATPTPVAAPTPDNP